MKRDENDWCEIEMAFNTWDKMKGNDNAWGETHKPLPEVNKNDEGWKRIIIELAIHTIIWNAMTMHKSKVRWHYMTENEKQWQRMKCKKGRIK